MRVFGKRGSIRFSECKFIDGVRVAVGGENYPSLMFNDGTLIFGDGPSGLGDIVVTEHDGVRRMVLRRDLPLIIAEHGRNL